MVDNICLAERIYKSKMLTMWICGFCFYIGCCLNNGNAAEVKELTFISTYDKSEQKALLQLPTKYDSSKKTPLLVWVQGMYTGPEHGLSYIGGEADKRDWFVLTVFMHGKNTGGSTNLGAPSAQQDIIDALNLALDTYPIDKSRIYLACMSMGALPGSLALENNPGRFASAAFMMGIFDLKDWYYEEKSVSGINSSIIKECGGTPQEVPNEYAIRSALKKADVFAKVPVLICHGRQDKCVSPIQSEKMIEEITKSKPSNLEIYWFEGDHSEGVIDKNRILSFLAQNTNQTDINYHNPNYKTLGFDNTRFFSSHAGEDWVKISATGVRECITEINPARTALLLVDLQTGCVNWGNALANYDKTVGESFTARMNQIVLPNVVKMLEFFRKNDMPVVYTRLGESGTFPDMIAPSAERMKSKREFIVSKYSPGAFATSTIDNVLRENGIATLFVAGVDTAACLLCTITAAHDRTYQVVLVEDACVSGRKELHESVITIWNYMGFVRKTEQVINDYPWQSWLNPIMSSSVETRGNAPLKWW
jgi:nicotinamidase-related amidase/poly(3-hydroxybutyrate) depolymerase